MLFVNISSDYVHLFDGLDEDYLPRNGIENILGATLLQYTQRHPVETLFLLNGPGGFTNLRVGTLAINTLNTLLQHDTGTFIPIASITKIDLYTYAYKQWRLPRYGILYIGQKHNVRRYDFQEQTHEQLTLEQLSSEIIWENLQKSSENNISDDIFLDWVHDPYWDNDEHMISFSIYNNSLILNYRGDAHSISLSDLKIPLTMTVEPQYLITPTLN